MSGPLRDNRVQVPCRRDPKSVYHLDPTLRNHTGDTLLAFYPLLTLIASTTLPAMEAATSAALQYGIAVAGAGTVLGLVCGIVLSPLLGSFLAGIIEQVLLLAFAWDASRRAGLNHHVVAKPLARLWEGTLAVALIVLLAAGLAKVGVTSNPATRQWLTPANGMGLLGQVGMALFPFIQSQV